jgi:hypothetical protein
MAFSNCKICVIDKIMMSYTDSIFGWFFQLHSHTYSTGWLRNAGPTKAAIASHQRPIRISNPTMRTGSKCEDLKSNAVRFGGFEMTSYTNKSLLN